MRPRRYVFLYLLNLGVILLVGRFQSVPGYMDAEYHYAGGLQLVEGKGFNEPFLWNYLDDPQGIPHPSHAYWPPLASLIAAAGMGLAGSTSFWAAKSGFILLAAGLAPATAHLGNLLAHNQRVGLLAGLLAAFSGFYLPFLGVSDIFGVVILLGASSLILCGKLFAPSAGAGAWRSRAWMSLLLGACCGLLQLARPDGAIWLLLCVGIAWMSGRETVEERPRLSARLSPVVAIVLGYALLMGPWAARNLTTFGTPLSPGGLRSLWLTRYDELYSYPANQLTFERWLETGAVSILRDRINALAGNLASGFAVQGLVYLFPLAVAGVWSLRKHWSVRLGVIAWFAILFVMTVLFPYSGMRGGFFHSAAATQSLWWALAAVGLERFVRWGAARRGWRANQAWWVFSGSACVLAASISAGLVWTRVIGDPRARPAWNQGAAVYRDMESALQAAGAHLEDRVAVNNPPGYYLASRRESIAIPDGDLRSLLAACERYGVDFVILERNHPQGLEEVYVHPEAWPELKLLKRVGEAQLFAVAP